MALITGLELLLDGHSRVLAHGGRVGIVANPTAVARDDSGRLAHVVDALAARDGIEVAVLFGPEHGIRGDAQDMIAVAEATDPRTGIPVRSLYGHDEASLSPRLEDVEGLDAVVFDIQDVGSRYYTYVWTMVLVMRVCARAGVPVVVLDRPNPIGGLVEGGRIGGGFESFVGLLSLPNRHGLTAGEIARWANATDEIGCDLEVVEMVGWFRHRYYDETGLPWIQPSPNMPTIDTAVVYPGMCLVEGTELSEGRGTTRPFEQFGAPYIDGHRLADELHGYDLPGVVFRPVGFLPQFQKHGGVPCGGVAMHVTDRDFFRPYLTGVACLRAVKQLYPDEFQWRTRAYEFVGDIPAIDLLCGGDDVRKGVEAGASLDDLLLTWSQQAAQLGTELREWHLYE